MAGVPGWTAGIFPTPSIFLNAEVKKIAAMAETADYRVNYPGAGVRKTPPDPRQALLFGCFPCPAVDEYKKPLYLDL